MQNKDAFLALVKAGLWEGSDDNNNLNENLFEDSDWDVVQKLAEEQSVIGLMAAGLDKFTDYRFPFVEKLKLLGKCQLIEQRNEAMNRFIAEMVKRMHKAGIKAVLVKGQGVAQCYERPLWRASGDIDFMMDEENYRKAKSLLMPLATHVEVEDRSKLHQGMRFEPWTVELHGTMHTGVSKRIDRIIDDVQKEVCIQGSVRCWNNGGVDVMLPSPGNDALLIFTHFIKHFYGSGIGLRQVCDWCRLLWTYRGQMDVELLHARLQAMGMLSEWKAFAAFAVEHLGMPEGAMPLYEKRMCHSRKATCLCRLVLETGNLGHNKNESYRTKYPKRAANVVTFFRRLGEFARIATIFPVDAPKFFVTYSFGRMKAVI